MILVIVSLYSFLGNSALLGPSVYIAIYSEEFGISPATASGLISYPNLAYGFGTVPPFSNGMNAVRSFTSRLSFPCSPVYEDRAATCHVAFNGNGILYSSIENEPALG